MARHDPGLFKERLGGAFQRGQTVWDKIFMGFIIVVWYGWLVLIALDARRWRLSHVPVVLSAVGVLLIAGGLFVVWLTFRENSFAAPVIRIQDERQQRVITTGPYAIVRHPMYAGPGVYMIGMPLLLGSWLGLLILPLILGALTLRIFIEEAVLRKGLPGYDEYAHRIRYRLNWVSPSLPRCPGVAGTRWLDDGVVGRGSNGEGLLGEAMKEQPAGL